MPLFRLRCSILLQLVISVTLGKILRKDCLLDGYFSKITSHLFLPKSLIGDKFDCENVQTCIGTCMYARKCKSVSYREETTKCALFNKDLDDEGVYIVQRDGWIHYQTDNTAKKVYIIPP